MRACVPAKNPAMIQSTFPEGNGMGPSPNIAKKRERFLILGGKETASEKKEGSRLRQFTTEGKWEGG